MLFLPWLMFWGLIHLTKAGPVSSVSARNEESLLPSANKTVLGRGMHLKEGDLNITTILSTTFFSVPHQIQSNYIMDFLMCVLGDRIFARFMVSFFVLGILGNVAIFSYLLFYIKRKSWNAYIWNFTIANCGIFLFLCSSFLLAFINYIFHSCDAFEKLFLSLAYLLLYTQCSCMHFIVGIGVDWVLLLLSPSWHRSHQPSLSSLISAVTSIVLWPLLCQLLFFFSLGFDTQTVVILSLILFLPLVSISFQTLIVNTWYNLGQRKKIHTERMLEMLGSIVTLVPLHLFFTQNSDCAIILLFFMLYVLFLCFARMS
ncbi:uncharacterized protein LOC144328658 [Podarcis muralis]